MTAALSVVSFVLAAIAYWRSGGKQDARKLRQEVEVLRAKQRELIETASRAVADASERSRKRLNATRDRLRAMKEGAREGLQTRIRIAEEQMEALAARLEAAAKVSKDETVAVAKHWAESIRQRVRRIEARARLMEAWDRSATGVIAAEQNDFDRAEQLLEEATDLLHAARRILEEDRVYDEQLDKVKKALRTATLAVRAHAADARQKIEQVMAETDRVVTDLETDEDKAEKQTALPGNSNEASGSSSSRRRVYEDSDSGGQQ